MQVHPVRITGGSQLYPLFPEGLQPRPQPGADLGFPVPPVTPECADGGQLAVSRPPGDGLRVDSEHRRDFSWCEQRLAVRAHISVPSYVGHVTHSDYYTTLSGE
jgi:hypothetical protein